VDVTTYYVAIVEPRGAGGGNRPALLIFVAIGLLLWLLFGPRGASNNNAETLFAEPPPLCACVFLHGAGNSFSEVGQSTNVGYWGSLETLLEQQCSRLLFMVEDTLHVRLPFTDSYCACG